MVRGRVVVLLTQGVQHPSRRRRRTALGVCSLLAARCLTRPPPAPSEQRKWPRFGPYSILRPNKCSWRFRGTTAGAGSEGASSAACAPRKAHQTSPGPTRCAQTNHFWSGVRPQILPNRQEALNTAINQFLDIAIGMLIENWGAPQMPQAKRLGSVGIPLPCAHLVAV